MPTKRPLFLLDLVISEDLCNLRCSYCYSHDILKLVKQSLHLEQNQIEDVIYVIDSVIREFDLGILKLSGGEILLFDNIMDLVKQVSPLAPRIQMQTNGTLFTDEIIEEIKSLGNVGIQFTLDGHLWEMNSYRVNKEKHRILLHNLNRLLKSEVPVEINCCIHDRNIDYLEEYAKYVAKLPGNPVLNFIPVRNKQREPFFPKPEKAEKIDRLIKSNNLAEVLPPKHFMIKMSDFIRYGTKKYKYTCRLPILTLGLNDQGVVKACPFLETTDTMSLGNVLKDDAHKVLFEVGNGRIHKLLQNPRLHPVACKQCFSYREIPNLYIGGDYGEEELYKYWFFNNAKVLDILRRTKALAAPE